MGNLVGSKDKLFLVEAERESEREEQRQMESCATRDDATPRI